jgi:hypothetical protein
MDGFMTIAELEEELTARNKKGTQGECLYQTNKSEMLITSHRKERCMNKSLKIPVTARF